MNDLLRGAGLALLLCGTVAVAALEGPGRNQFLKAARANADMDIDGRLDEPAWESAPSHGAFVQRVPHSGAAPSERTEVRVLYDSDNLYVGVLAHDSQPELIDGRLGRRDSMPSTDSVQLIIDSAHDHRTAYSFTLTASGVQGDGLFYEDSTFTADWDAVWAGATQVTDSGWVAEFAIPLSALRFPEREVQTWGFSVRRNIARKSEELESVENPPTSNANVSRLGHLTGMEGLRPRRAVEFIPYVAARAALRPQFSDPAVPDPRLLQPTFDVGLDMRAALTSDLSLVGTVNPDFGQVEADQLILNLSTFETFFPEKRPFFTQGLELFAPVGENLGVPQRLFYSRRIGLVTPILAAAKVTGAVSDRVEIGVLDALVTGPWLVHDEENPDHRWSFHPTRPLHFAPNRALPGQPQAPINFLAAVARGRVTENARAGGSFAAALPLVGGCTEEEAALPLVERPPACVARGGMGAALDFDVKSADSEYGVLGQLSGSRIVGGPPARLLPDGTLLERGDTGWGGYVRGGRFGGEGFRWDVGYDFATPTLDLNATGFQQNQNIHGARGGLHYERTTGVGALRSVSANLVGGSSWSVDRGLNRGSWANLNGYVQLPSADYVGLEFGMNVGGYDIRELRGTGVPIEQQRFTFAVAFAESNPNRPVQVMGSFAFAHFERRPAAGDFGGRLNGTVVVRPHAALETRLEFTADRSRFGPRYISQPEDTRFLLGLLDSDFLSLTLRQQWVLRPTLTLQAYAQLFTAYGVYGQLYEGSTDAGRSVIRRASLVHVEGEASNFYESALNVNVVLRWEYRLGSTFFVVYTRSQQSLPTAPGEEPPATLLPRRLFSGAATDALMLKWSYYWDT